MPAPRPTSPGLAAELQLREHFARKRGARRHVVSLDVWVQGTSSRLKARVVDVSRTGLLLELVEAPGSLLEYAAFVRTHFGQGVRVRFPQERYAPHARLVRVTASPAGRCLVALRFSKPLRPAQCRRLGMPVSAQRRR